jgi:MTH538 TIR-like domain (DUF1863)
MARKVFFSFHYSDIWRANIVRNSGMIEGYAVAGFHDASLWEEAKKKGEAAVQHLIDAGLEGTSVTVVLIGAETANRQWLSYEIERSIARKNGLLGITIDTLKDQYGKAGEPGPMPEALSKAGAAVYTWEYGKLALWVEEAYRKANP